MRYMKIRKYWIAPIALVLMPLGTLAQLNNLTGSPYSLFGLGVRTNSNIGKNNALGKGGYALEATDFINNFNPAAFAGIPKKNFLFDIGILTELSRIESGNNDERRLAGNISSIAIAASIDKNSGFGLTLDPLSDVGYAVVGIESNIEGSLDSFVSSIFGSGGISDLKLSYGYRINDYVKAGIGLSYLFGNITETERINAGVSSLTVEETNVYNGGRVEVGLQGKFSNTFSFGTRWQLPTALNGKRDRSIQKIIDLVPAPSTVENTNDVDIPNFDLPLEVSTGVAFRPLPNLNFNLDYTKSYWNATDQSDNIGDFVDQDIVAIGAEYMKDPDSFRYWERIQFRAGFNYDSGYLEVNNEAINSFSITGGIGFPVGRSRLNLAYTYRESGSSNGILVQEAFNTININFSLRDFWFLKRKVE